MNGPSMIVAENGSNGSSAHELNEPNRIFVDLHQNLFVTNFLNNRVQRFRTSARHGETVLAYPLRGPTAVVVDLNENLFVVDASN